MIFEEITEEILNEKLITYGNRKPYGQVVFVTGGAGSGKGFAIKNFLDSVSFRLRDVDEMKKQLQILNRLGKIDINTIIKKHGRNIKPKDIDLINKIQDEGFKLQNLNLKNPDHVYALHILVDAMGIKDKTLESLLSGKNNPETLPNILFDITAKKITSITSVIADLKKAGYKADNIHLTWILTNYVTAMVNNKNRARMVPEDILLQTHEGASNTIWGIVTKALPKGMNGRIDVILNNPEHTVFYTDDDGKTINGKVKGFKSLPLKKEKGGIYPEKVWKDKLFGWVKDNAPESITANMKESTNESVTENRFANKPEVTPKQLLNIQADVRKINRKIKVYISKHPITKGELNIELGHGHDNDVELDKIYKVLKKHTGDWRTGSMFNESLNKSIRVGKVISIKKYNPKTNSKESVDVKITNYIKKPGSKDFVEYELKGRKGRVSIDVFKSIMEIVK